ncbi:iron-sulfur cluster assembly accessory protein [Candidatus Woesearchaeota archaeon]|nr:iron-sulfur cluster assembly accessory protein [Candidatus Woesearchaeota archaeon]
MKTKQVNEYVNKDMIIGDVLKEYPDVAVIMLENGLHCVGCHANVFDTIEAGSLGHGMSEEQVAKMVIEMNQFIAQSLEQKKDLPQSVGFTDNAAQKVKALLLKSKQEGYGLRVQVMPGGCSGFVYQMNFEKAPQSDDIVVEDKGVKLFIDKESMDLLKGSEIDYLDDLNQSGFKVNNPNAKHGCGCGKSFG